MISRFFAVAPFSIIILSFCSTISLLFCFICSSGRSEGIGEHVDHLLGGCNKDDLLEDQSKCCANYLRRWLFGLRLSCRSISRWFTFFFICGFVTRNGRNQNTQSQKMIQIFISTKERKTLFLLNEPLLLCDYKFVYKNNRLFFGVATNIKYILWWLVLCFEAKALPR